MIFIATTHEYKAELDKKLIRERRIKIPRKIYFEVAKFSCKVR